MLIKSNQGIKGTWKCIEFTKRRQNFFLFFGFFFFNFFLLLFICAYKAWSEFISKGGVVMAASFFTSHMRWSKPLHQ
jgi:hypothetical protein